MGNGKSCLPCVAKPVDDKIPVKKSELADLAQNKTINITSDVLLTMQTLDSPSEKENDFLRPITSASSENTIFVRSYLEDIEPNQKSILETNFRN
jgi:hypothetical protein